MDLSFCITCKNRFDQIKKTIKKNLEDNYNSKYKIEFILVDFGSTDSLRNHITTFYQKELKSEYLKYYYTDELIYWHASIAKNTAHLLSSGKYVVNLDCDNYTGKNGGDIIIEKFLSLGDDIIIHQTSNIFGSGTMGRIGLTKNNFLKLGGYDQDLKPMGHQDGDLINRAKAIGLKYVLFNDYIYNKTIINSKKKSLENIYGNYDYLKMMKVNMIYSNLGIRSNVFISNNYFKTKQLGVLINIFRVTHNKILRIN